MFKSKKIVLIMLLMAVLTFASVGQVKATTDNPIELPIIGGNEEINDDANAIIANQEAANAIIADEELANAEAANSEAVEPETNQEGSSYENTELPQTGVTEDITVMFFIIVCAISAIYAYKKIRDYNKI